MNDLLNFIGDVVDALWYIFFGSLALTLVLSFILTLIFKKKKSLFVLMTIGICVGIFVGYYEWDFLGFLIALVSVGVFGLALLIHYLKFKLKQVRA
jgi:hypothetical protein